MTPEAPECVVEAVAWSTGDTALTIIGIFVAVVLLLLISRNREGGWGPSH